MVVNMKKIYAILPCYNEADNIGNLIDSWNKEKNKLNKAGYELKVVAIDDCSTDDTKKIILEKKKKYDNVDIIIHKENKGLCGGLNSALSYFNKKGKKGDLLVLMDGDNTHDPKYVHNMLKILSDDKNCIIASRYREGSNIVGLAKNRELMSEFAKIYYELTLNIPDVLDYTCGYRMYTYEIIDKLLNKFGDESIKEKSFACMMELLYKVYLVGGKFDEVGFELRYDNKCGESKMKVMHTATRSIKTALKLKFRYDMGALITILILLLFATFLSFGTNYSPVGERLLGHDCSIFSYVAFAMQRGKVLYSEVWENKGPLLYFIYYLGLSMNMKYGIYLLEWLSIFIGVLFGYKTLYLITSNKIYSIIGLIYSFSIWTVTFEKGTISETFSLPLICIGLFMFTKYMLKDKKITNRQIIIFGLLTGLIAQLRLNLLAIFLSLFIIIGIRLLINKELKEILRWIINGVLGVIISVIPSMIYLVKNNALLDCLNSAYLNILDGFNIGSVQDRVNALMEMINITNISGIISLLIIFTIVSLPLISFRKEIKKEYKLYTLAIILSIVLNLYANSVSGAVHLHYFFTFIPVIIMLIGIMIWLVDKIHIKYIFKVSAIALIIGYISYPSYEIYYNYHIKKIETNSLQIKVDEYIYNNSNSEDLVQLIGGVGANFRTNRLAASKYSYLPLWSTFTKERKEIMTNELVRDIRKNIPKLIFIGNDYYIEFNQLIKEKQEWNKFLDDNYVVDVNSVNEFVIYVRK